jgi:predicted nucleotidyltransferase
MPARIPIDQQSVGDFCRRWDVVELGLFGSVLRDDFRPDSDVDVFVTFQSDARPSLFDLAAMQDELSVIFGRRVDLGTKRSLKPSIKDDIIASAEVLFAA